MEFMGFGTLCSQVSPGCPAQTPGTPCSLEAASLCRQWSCQEEGGRCQPRPGVPSRASAGQARPAWSCDTSFSGFPRGLCRSSQGDAASGETSELVSQIGI